MTPGSRLAALLPVVDWLPRYRRKWLRGDVIAGIAVAALIVPKNLGYAGIAGVPLENGLYAAAAGALIYAVFCTSRQISTGPSSSLAAVAGGAVLVTQIDEAQAPQLVAAITLVTGALFLLMALFRLGWIARFLSKAVITGFLAGAAVDVTIGELPKLTGTSTDGDNAWQELSSWLGTLGEIDWTTLARRTRRPRRSSSGCGSWRRPYPGRSCSWSAGCSRPRCWTSALTGSRSSATSRAACPHRRCPMPPSSRTTRATIGIAAFALLLIGFSQTAGDARAFAARHRYRIDVNQESIAQGMANAGAGVFQGMPVSTSLSASSLNESSGARTPLASLVTGTLVILTLLFLAPLFSDLPKAVLAALIIDAVVFGMIDVRELRRLHRVARIDFWIAVAAIVGVLSAGVLAGVVIGVALSLVWLIYVATTPAIPLLSRQPGTQVFRDADEHPGDETFDGVIVLRLDFGLSFATAEALDDRVRALWTPNALRVPSSWTSPASTSSTPRGRRSWASIQRFTDASDVTLRLARLKPPIRDTIATDGVLDEIGEAHVHGNVNEAVEAQLDDR